MDTLMRSRLIGEVQQAFADYTTARCCATGKAAEPISQVSRRVKLTRERGRL